MTRTCLLTLHVQDNGFETTFITNLRKKQHMSCMFIDIIHVQFQHLYITLKSHFKIQQQIAHISLQEILCLKKMGKF